MTTNQNYGVDIRIYFKSQPKYKIVMDIHPPNRVIKVKG